MTPRFVFEVRRLTGHPFYLFHVSTMVHSEAPIDWTYESRRPAVVFNFWQDHAIFYDRTVGNGVCKMKPHIPTGIPTQKLYDQAEEHNRTVHKELAAFDYNGMLAAVNGKTHVAYHVPDLEGIGKLRQVDRITSRPTWIDHPIP